MICKLHFNKVVIIFQKKKENRDIFQPDIERHGMRKENITHTYGKEQATETASESKQMSD